MTREPGGGVRRGSGNRQGVECECEGRACSAGAQEACKWPGEPRVCTRGAGVRGAMRCAVRGVAGPGKGARRALCRACVCKRGAGMQTREVHGARGSAGSGPCVRPRALLWGRRGAYSPPLRLPRGIRLRAPGSRPASRSAQAPAPSLAVARNATPAVSPGALLGGARRGPGARSGRGGGRELRRSPGTLPGACRALPCARPPARSLFNLK